jgi:hypothetical protein
MKSHSRESGNPESSKGNGSPVKLGMTKRNGFPVKLGMTKREQGGDRREYFSG